MTRIISEVPEILSVLLFCTPFLPSAALSSPGRYRANEKSWRIKDGRGEEGKRGERGAHRPSQSPAAEGSLARCKHMSRASWMQHCHVEAAYELRAIAELEANK